ncbi:phosphopantetheine-binding protein, partial [Micromonospora sp. NPDC051196]|uniref:phosphopantetheine-binding protein n=1 Tax=Micromonospora sp. NPDC051196 TaxID=3155281 RepID=UPI003415CED3
EHTLTKIWTDILGTDRIGIHDNFFDLGGHSLLLPRLQARISEELHATVPITAFFQDTTVHALARRLTSTETSEADSGARQRHSGGARLEARRRRQSPPRGADA